MCISSSASCLADNQACVQQERDVIWPHGMQEAIGSYERCLELAPQSRNAGQNRLLALNYIMPGEDAAVCTAHTEWSVSRICP